MMRIGKLGLLLALLAGLGAGVGAAWFNHAQTAPVVAKIDAERFPVDLANTPGFPAVKTGDFNLIDNHGKPRTSKNPNGLHQLVFFGYASCKAICSVALPNMTEAVDLLAEMDVPVTPILITVDPIRDTVAALNTAVKARHPKLVGLTGPEENLQAAFKAFNLERKFLFDHAEEGAVYSHGSFIYLLNPEGKFRTLFAPVVSPVRIAEITAGYIAEDQKLTN